MLEEDENEILPRPPLFAYRAPEEEEEDPCLEMQEKDKWRMFHELRQKKKKLMREANPFINLKIPPPPLPPMRPRLMFQSRRKYRYWQKRRHLFQGKTF